MSANAAGLLWVAAGAALGGGLRYAINVAFARHDFPLATLIVNVTGSFAIGACAAYAAAHGISEAATLWQFAVPGALGAFTTVSAFSLATLELAKERRTRLALINIAASVFLCLTACALGYYAVST